MKQFFLCILLCASLLLVACATAPEGGSGSLVESPTAEPSTVEGYSTPGTDKPQKAVLLCRIVDGAEDGELLLAEEGEGLYGGTGVYRLSVSACNLLVDGVPMETTNVVIENGSLVEVSFDGAVQETFPAQFADVDSLNILSQGRDDLCGLYLDVLEELWVVDDALNSELSQLGVDLSLTRLSLSERAALAWAFGQRHGLAPVQGTWEELEAHGYFKAEPLGEDAPEGAAFYHWENGCLFSIKEKNPEEDGDSVQFDVQKWRSSRGAYYFQDCTAKRSTDGVWPEYNIGSQAIS